MSRILTYYLKQYCLYWKRIDTDQFGEPVYDNPVERRCRWEHNIDQIFDGGGRQLADSTIVYFDDVTIKEGDAILHFEDIDLSNYVEGSLIARLDSDLLTDPMANGANEIRKIEKMPNKTGTKYLILCFI